MEEMLLSPDLLAELAACGKVRAQKFSWELCAEETFAVLEQVARTGRAKTRATGVAV
jgi:hypothetical protein